ncbi:hypothetical protein CSKR_202750 [Clonorchis sinensis]|uniref:Uncharacterized protein n=1 Tax=Clonorchis sinensis TaxID=79923 RepID=A0A8T1M2K0_CLOSI|nr:hypothetical protein CSKR_202750 [Clonorchis sinensis]
MLPTLSVYSSNGEIGLRSRILKKRDWLSEEQPEPKPSDWCKDNNDSLPNSIYARYKKHDGISFRTTYMSLCSDRNKGVWKRFPDDMKTGTPSSYAHQPFLMNSKRDDRFRIYLPTQRILTTYKPKTCYQKAFCENIYSMTPEPNALSSDLFAGSRRMLSQFTDHGTHRRIGHNTWADESSIYADTHIRRQLDASRDHTSELLNPSRQPGSWSRK